MPDLEELLSKFDPERQERLRQLIARRKQYTPQQLNPEAEYGARPTDDSVFWNQVNQATLPARQVSPNIAWQSHVQPQQPPDLWEMFRPDFSKLGKLPAIAMQQEQPAFYQDPAFQNLQASIPQTVKDIGQKITESPVGKFTEALTQLPIWPTAPGVGLLGMAKKIPKGEFPKPSENPYLKMPIKRVQQDAEKGVNLAKEALEARKGGIGKVPEPKEPWQMTLDRYESTKEIFDTPENPTLYKRWMEKAGVDKAHKESVEKALSEGKPVPAEVLKDYPDLAAKTPAVPEAKVAPEVTKGELYDKQFAEAMAQNVKREKEFATLTERHQAERDAISDRPRTERLALAAKQQAEVEAFRAESIALPQAKPVTPTAPAVKQEAGMPEKVARFWNSSQLTTAEKSQIAKDAGISAPARISKNRAWWTLSEQERSALEPLVREKMPKPSTTPEIPIQQVQGKPVTETKPPVAQPTKAEVPSVQQPSPKQPEFAGNIRLSKYPEDLRKQLIDYANTHADEVNVARRGIRSDAQVLSDAKQLIEENGGNFERIQKRWKPGESWNAEEITAMRGLLRTKTEAVTQAQQLVKESNSSSNLLKLGEALQENANAQQLVHGITAEAGRSLRSFRQEAFNAIKSNDNQKMEELLKRIGGREHIENLAERIGQLDLDNPGQVARFLNQVSQKSKSEKFFSTLTWIFYNSILSGPKTHIINSLTNVGNALTSPLERGVAALVDIPLAKVAGRSRSRFLNEVPADVVGAVQGIDEGARAWLYTWKHGISWNQASKWDFRQPPIAYTKVGRVLGSPLTGMEAADSFMKQVNFRSAFNATAQRMAKQEGLTGQRFTERVADLLSNPPIELISQADKRAEYLLFRQKPDSFIQGLINLREKGVGGFKPLTFVIPFLRTPSNILKYGLERSPLGLLNVRMWKNIKQPEAADQLARVIIGSGLAAAIAVYASQGKLTGAAPTDRAERDTFYRQGKQPFSIKIGNNWIQYQRIEPLNQTLSQIAATIDAVKDKATKGIDQMASQAVSTIGQNLVSQTYLSSLSDLLDALNDPERNAANWLSKFGASMAVPFSSASRTAAQMIDPTVRQPSGVVEQIQANVPMLSQQVPAKVTALGEETKRLANPWFPIAISLAQEDALTNELTRLNKNVGFVGSVIANVKLDPDKQREYQVQAGQMTKAFLVRLLSNPEYKRATDVQKGYMIDKLISDAREKARNEILPKLDLPMAEKARVKFSQFGASIAQFEKTLGLKWDDPKAEAIIRTADKYFTPYWQIESDVWNQVGTIPGTNVQYKVLSDAWEKLAEKDAKKAKDLMFASPYGPTILNARREVLVKKRDMRLNTPMLESMLKLFY